MWGTRGKVFVDGRPCQETHYGSKPSNDGSWDGDDDEVLARRVLYSEDLWKVGVWIMPQRVTWQKGSLVDICMVEQ